MEFVQAKKITRQSNTTPVSTRRIDLHQHFGVFPLMAVSQGSGWTDCPLKEDAIG